MDGNYRSFKVGQTRQFAVEIYIRDFELVDDHSVEKSVERVSGEQFMYSIVAPVSYIDGKIFMVDLGPVAYGESPPLGTDLMKDDPRRAEKMCALSVGDVIKADVILSIDHYAYFEQHCKRPGVPRIIYTWHINGIESMTGQLVGDLSKPIRMWDRSGIQWHVTDETNGKTTSNSCYAINCTLLPVPSIGAEHTLEQDLY